MREARPISDPVRLLLVRHGQTDWNREGRYQGRSDPPLAPEGSASVKALAERLRGVPIAALLTSPLRRAAETADLLAQALGLPPPQIDPRLTELAFGAWEGLTQAEVKARWPQSLRAWKRAPDTVRFPGGEDLAAVDARLADLLRTRPWEGDRSGSASSGSAILLVTHAGPIRLLRLAAEGRKPAEFRRIEVGPASLHVLDLHRLPQQDPHPDRHERRPSLASCGGLAAVASLRVGPRSYLVAAKPSEHQPN
ncbi:MAG: histidine phosphatase family protein [Rhodospirillales bacterium]|nr:histidine phosphatase family protein [Rhodospirillales bacterium]